VGVIRDSSYKIDDFEREHPEEVCEYLETDTSFDSGVV
jgi:hypothetical protein